MEKVDCGSNDVLTFVGKGVLLRFSHAAEIFRAVTASHGKVLQLYERVPPTRPPIHLRSREGVLPGYGALFSFIRCPICTSCCSFFLPLSITGTAKPSGSHTELTMDSTPLLVNGFSGKDTLTVKASVSRSQNTPSERWAGKLKLSRRNSRSRTSFGRSSAEEGFHDFHWIRNQYV